MKTDQATHATPRALGSTEGLGQLPEPEELDADYNDAGRVVAYGYTANTVRRLLAAERERCEARFHAALSAGREVLDRQVVAGVRAYVEQTIRNEWIRKA